MTTISGDCWDEEAGKDHWEVENATGDDFDHALDQLDGSARTTLTIHGEGEQRFIIGGGEGRYVVCGTFDNDNYFTLQGPEPAAGSVLLFIGGQEGDYPASVVVSKDQARAVGRVFFNSRQLDPTQKWLDE